MKTLLAIDLESTIIPHWTQMGTYINFDKLDAIIKEYQPEDWLIYSYAVWNNDNYDILRKSQLIKDLSEKNKNGYIRIKKTYEMVEDWLSLHQHKYLEPQPQTIWNMPKEFAFLITVRRMVEDGNDYQRYVLFDDTAPHKLHYKIGDVEVVFLNPDNME